MVAGRNSPDDSVEENYLLVRRLLEMFKGKFGTVNCRELIDCDLGTQKGREKFQADNLSRRCREYTAEAAAMALLLIEEKSGD
ncbi:MAG: C_GCAxxG_C_C family protein [Deferribacteres bacterium]|nr:C_GCAxxG_C_C family protein [Deferribacteres bacterium]